MDNSGSNSEQGNIRMGGIRIDGDDNVVLGDNSMIDDEAVLEKAAAKAMDQFLKDGSFGKEAGEIQQALAVTEEATMNFFNILKKKQVPIDKLGEVLHQITNSHNEALRQLAAIKVHDQASQENINEARVNFENGRYGSARELMQRVRAAQVEAAKNSKQLEGQGYLAAAEFDSVIAVSYLAECANLNAAKAFAGASELVPPGYPDSLGYYLIRQGVALNEYGDQEGDNDALRRAVGVYKQALLAYTRERAPLDWSGTQNNLGNALSTLGEREAGTSGLERAVQAYKQALLEWTRERVPQEWAGTQNNLGNALSTLGEREHGTVRLRQAVQAYEQALLEWTRESVPLDWAMTQNNLGNAFQTLGKREAGKGHLEQAVQAYEQALLEWTRERVPLDWATTQNNLGTALETLGSRESGTLYLEQAVQAYEQALLERTRERVPLDWAATQNNLGNALRRLGCRESGATNLERAVQAYEQALLERTRERGPLDWATTQYNLGNALRRLGYREAGTARLEQAAQAYEQALLERSRERVPLDWAPTQMNLGLTWIVLAERKANDRSLLLKAKTAISLARQVYIDEAKQEQYTTDFDSQLKVIDERLQAKPSSNLAQHLPRTESLLFLWRRLWGR